MKTKKVLYIVSNIFSHHIAHTFLSQTFDFHHFTTHIYASHYTPLSPLPYAALQLDLNFLDGFSKNTQMSNFVNTQPVGAELSNADRRTERHGKANSRISQFCERP